MIVGEGLSGSVRQRYKGHRVGTCAPLHQLLHDHEIALPSRDVQRREALRCALGFGVEGLGLRVRG